MLILGCLTAAEFQQHDLNATQEYDEKKHVLLRSGRIARQKDKSFFLHNAGGDEHELVAVRGGGRSCLPPRQQ